jgi:hypothetical protein
MRRGWSRISDRRATDRRDALADETFNRIGKTPESPGR